MTHWLEQNANIAQILKVMALDKWVFHSVWLVFGSLCRGNSAREGRPRAPAVPAPLRYRLRCFPPTQKSRCPNSVPGASMVVTRFPDGSKF